MDVGSGFSYDFLRLVRKASTGGAGGSCNCSILRTAFAIVNGLHMQGCNNKEHQG